MAKGSKIKWTDDTLNSVLGCTKCSAGCTNCYAVNEAWRKSSNRRLGIGDRNPFRGLTDKDSGGVNWTGKVHFLPERFDEFKGSESRKIFVNSLSDLFHEGVSDEWIQEHFKFFASTPQHQFQILTKRSKRLMQLSDSIAWPDNVWQGVSVENLSSIHRIQDLGATGAAIKFVSFEPLLSEGRPLRTLAPRLRHELQQARIDWVIVGGESSRSKDVARIMRIDDALFVIEEAQAAGASVMLKQLGTRWAIASGTYRRLGSEGKVTKEIRSGGDPSLWPKSLQGPELQQFPRY